MEQSDLFINFTILLGAALVGGMIAHRLRQPIILGYLIVGVAIGPHALGLVDDVALVKAMAIIGVALLMLTLGLQVSFSQLRQVGKVGLWGGAAQILVTFALGFIAGITLFEWSPSQSALFGLIISLSSTMVCLKILMDRGELDSVHGRIMVAMLILQDISVVLMIIIMPILGGAEQNIPLVLAIALGKAVLFIGITIHCHNHPHNGWIGQRVSNSRHMTLPNMRSYCISVVRLPMIAGRNLLHERLCSC